MPGPRDVEWTGNLVTIREAGRVVATGRWSGGRIVDRSGMLGDGAPEAWAALEAALREESESLIQANLECAYDSRGVDVTQIDRMLSLSPLERLQALDAQRRSMQRLVGDVTHD